jgi:hypothetical protein
MTTWDKAPIRFAGCLLLRLAAAATQECVCWTVISFHFSWNKLMFSRLRADSRGANKSLKTVGISHAPEAALPACSCRRLAPPLWVKINIVIHDINRKKSKQCLM